MSIQHKHGLLAEPSGGTPPPVSGSHIFTMDPSTGVTLDGGKIASISLLGGLTAIGMGTGRPSIETINGFPVVRVQNNGWLEIPSLTLGYFTIFAVWVNMPVAHVYISEHNTSSWVAGNPGGYDFAYNSGVVELCIQRTNIDTISSSALPVFGNKCVYTHRWGNNVAEGNIDKLYLNSTTPVNTSAGRVEESATAVFAIGGGVGSGGTNADFAWFEVHKNMTDLEVEAKITELMTKFSTL